MEKKHIQNITETDETVTITFGKSNPEPIEELVEEANTKAVSDIDTKPTDGMVTEAIKGLEWRKEHGRGGTAVGVARATSIKNRENLSPDTIKRMYSYFSRHEVDKQGEGYKPGEDGFPSAGRIAWALWGGDAGYSWSKRKVAEIKREEEKSNNIMETKDKKIIDKDFSSKKTEKFFRTVSLNKKDLDEENRSINLSFSSETPYERNFGMEIIDHDKMDLEFLDSGNAPLLLDHDPVKQIGIIEKVTVADKRGRASVRFGKSDLADSVFQDVQDGIRTNVSFGYEIMDMEKVKGYDDDDDDKASYRVSTRPLEISLVSIPADTTVGVNRAKENNNNNETIKEIKVMEKENKIQEQKSVVVDNAKLTEEVRKTELDRVREISAIGSKHNLRSFADESIKSGVSVAQFKGLVLEKIGNDKPLETPVDSVDMSAKEQKEYSLTRMINAQVSGNYADAGFEKEVSDEIAKRSNKSARGFFVPQEVWKRDLSVGTNSAGGFLRPDVHRSDLYIDLLRDEATIGRLGATVLNGLSGNIQVPKMAGGSSAGFVAENSAVAENNPSFAQKTMTAKSLGGFIDVSRHLLAQSSPSIDGILRADMISAIANKIDDVAFEGGGSNEPSGILDGSPNVIAIGTNGGAVTYSSTIDCITQVAKDKGLRGNLGYVTTPEVIGSMRTTPKVSSTDSVMIMNDANTLNGYNIFGTNQMPSNLTKGSTSGSCHAMIFGNFAEVMIGFFSAVDVLVDPYTASSSGITRLVFMQDMDIIVRHDESFGAIKDITV